MADFHLKVDDQLPVLEATLVDADGKPIDLTAATSVTFRMRVKQTDPFIDIVATIVSPETLGRVDVPWGASDTDSAGHYKALFKVVFPGPKTMSVPNKGCKSIAIEDDC